MFAINHAATALIIKRRFPGQPILWILLSVQAMELLWVVFNLLGVEHMSTEAAVHSTADIHLAHMPYSHSVATMLGAAVAVWLACRFLLKRPMLGLALGIGILSHFLLDLVTHAQDIVLAPGLIAPKLGLGLYSALPFAAFVIEIAYGAFCWWVYEGGKLLLAVVLLSNAANLSFLSPRITGPESILAERPQLIALVILVQIVITLFLVGFYSRRPLPGYISNRSS